MAKQSIRKKEIKGQKPKKINIKFNKKNYEYSYYYFFDISMKIIIYAFIDLC